VAPVLFLSMNYELPPIFQINSNPNCFSRQSNSAVFPSNHDIRNIKIRDTSDQRRDTASAKRAGIHNQNPKILKKFSPSLTPFPTRSYLFSVFSETSVANVFFVPNAQVRPFIERRSFSAPVLLWSVRSFVLDI